MSKVDFTALHETIERDRRTIRADLLETLPESGKLDRERLRRVLAADRAELYRTEGARNTAEFLAGVFHITKWKAQRWIGAAHALEHLPHISAALESGSLSLDKTVELTRFATPQTERKLVRWARRVTVGCIRQRGDEAIAVSKKDIQEGHQQRRLEWWFSDQVLWFQGALPAEQGAAFVEAVDRLAHELPEDPDLAPALFDDEAHSMDQRRVDALFLLATSAKDGETAVPTVVVHVPAQALGEGEGNGVTESGTVLAPELVRMLACDSRIQAILEDPDGHPLGAGTEARFPSRDLRRAVLQRDGHTCTFPGCGMKRFLHMHHIEHWPQGRTEYWNLVTVCKVHHDAVHKMGWNVSLEDGHATWFRPLGRRYEPGPAPPDPPMTPERRRVLMAEAATHAGLDRLIRVLAGGRGLPQPDMPARKLRTRAAREFRSSHRSVA